MLPRTIYSAATCLTVAAILYSNSAAAVIITFTDVRDLHGVKAVLRPNVPTVYERAYKPPAWLKNVSTYVGTSYSVNYKLFPVKPARSVTSDQNIGGGGTIVVTKSFSQNQLLDTRVGKFALYNNGVLNSTSAITYNPDTSFIYAPDSFRLKSFFKTYGSDKSMADTGIKRGVVIANIKDVVDYKVDADPNSWFYKGAQFLDNVKSSLSISIMKRTENLLKSLHIINIKSKSLYSGRAPGLGVRASISMDGTGIFTASPGNLTYDVTFGDDPTLFLPFAFGENKDEATLEVFFNDNLLGSVKGIDYGLDELDFFQLDISSYLGMSGSLDFVLNTTGTQSANAFIPSSISTVPVPSAVWLFGSGLIALIGIARKRTRI